MVRNSSAGATASEINAINLSRMIARLQHSLITPDSATEAKLRTSRYERDKIGTNLEHARDLLTRVEQDALTIRNQSQKQSTQASLVQKRETLQLLIERLQELNELGDHELEDDDSSEGEDLLGEDTPGDETDEQDGEVGQDITPPATASTTTSEDRIVTPIEELPVAVSSTYIQPSPQATTTSELRSRGGGAQTDRDQLLKPSSTSTGISTSTAESLLTHNRTEQESLTSSLLNMATQLKQQSRAFAHSLEEEKDVLGRATEGLDRNELGLEAAQRKMGFLRGYTEGMGWWGRMLMYCWIAGLMILALVIVFVLPKLRF